MTMQVEVTPESEAALNYERSHHPVPVVQRRREALWLERQGLPPSQIAQVVGITENTLRDDFQLYLDGGGEGRKAVAIQGPVSALAAHDDSWEASLRAPPPATLKEAPHALAVVRGSKRGESQGREVLKKHSLFAAAASGGSPPKPTPPAKRPC